MILDLAIVARFVAEKLPEPLAEEAPEPLAEALEAHVGRVRHGDTQGLAVYLDGLGPEGRRLAADLRTSNADLWSDPARMAEEQRWLRCLAFAVWHDLVAPELENRRRRGSPAMPIALHRRVAGLRRHWVEAGRLRSEGVPLVPLVPVDALAELPGLGQIGSVLTGRVIDWFAVELFERDVRMDPSNRVEIVGGWSGWADLLGLDANSGKVRAALHDLAEVMTRTTVSFAAPGRYGTMALLAGWELERGTQGRPGVLRLHLSELFRPGLVHLLTGSERRLVPVVGLPPFGAVNPRLHPAAARLHRLALGELVEQAREFTTGGGAQIDWERLAGEAGLGVEHVPALLASWSDTWERMGADRWRLRAGAGNDAAIAFLREGAALSENGERRGRRSAARRRGRVTR